MRISDWSSDVCSSDLGQGPSDALVLFGITGDLAYKTIFPALYAMAQRGKLNLPIVGVASSALTTAPWRRRIKNSIGHSGLAYNKATLKRLSYMVRNIARPDERDVG